MSAILSGSGVTPFWLHEACFLNLSDLPSGAREVWLTFLVRVDTTADPHINVIQRCPVWYAKDETEAWRTGASPALVDELLSRPLPYAYVKDGWARIKFRERGQEFTAYVPEPGEIAVEAELPCAAGYTQPCESCKFRRVRVAFPNSSRNDMLAFRLRYATQASAKEGHQQQFLAIDGPDGVYRSLVSDIGQIKDEERKAGCIAAFNALCGERPQYDCNVAVVPHPDYPVDDFGAPTDVRFTESPSKFLVEGKKAPINSPHCWTPVYSVEASSDRFAASVIVRKPDWALGAVGPDFDAWAHVTKRRAGL